MKLESALSAYAPLLRFGRLASSIRTPLVLAGDLGCLLLLLQPPLPVQVRCLQYLMLACGVTQNEGLVL